MKDELYAQKQKLQSKLEQYTTDLQNQKKELEEGWQGYRENLTEKFKGSVDLLSKSKYVAIGLGALYLIYKMTSWIWDSPPQLPTDEDSNGERIIVVQQPANESSIVRRIKDAIASFILSIAKKELQRVIQKLKEEAKQKAE